MTSWIVLAAEEMIHDMTLNNPNEALALNQNNWTNEPDADHLPTPFINSRINHSIIFPRENF